MERSAFYYISDESLFNYTVFSSSAAFSMPESYLKLQTPPDNPVDDWLLWSAFQLESFIGDTSNKKAGIIGIYKAGDLQYIIIPTTVPEGTWSCFGCPW